ncbi:unnamed protein product [Musa acuminata subsp. burmannicoides]
MSPSRMPSIMFVDEREHGRGIQTLGAAGRDRCAALTLHNGNHQAVALLALRTSAISSATDRHDDIHPSSASHTMFTMYTASSHGIAIDIDRSPSTPPLSFVKTTPAPWLMINTYKEGVDWNPSNCFSERLRKAARNSRRKEKASIVIFLSVYRSGQRKGSRWNGKGSSPLE